MILCEIFFVVLFFKELFSILRIMNNHSISGLVISSSGQLSTIIQYKILKPSALIWWRTFELLDKSLIRGKYENFSCKLSLNIFLKLFVEVIWLTQIWTMAATIPLFFPDRLKCSEANKFSTINGLYNIKSVFLLLHWCCVYFAKYSRQMSTIDYGRYSSLLVIFHKPYECVTAIWLSDQWLHNCNTRVVRISKI